MFQGEDQTIDRAKEVYQDRQGQEALLLLVEEEAVDLAEIADLTTPSEVSSSSFPGAWGMEFIN